MPDSAFILVHYHELWLKQGNRFFFQHQLRQAMKRALGGIRVVLITEPGHRYLIELADATQTSAAIERLSRVFGISHYAVARTVPWKQEDAAGKLREVCDVAWQEIREQHFATFAVRAKRSEKRFPLRSLSIEREVGGELFDRLVAEGRSVRVGLRNPELTCRIEVTPGPILIFARRIEGPGGLPANTAGRLTCLLSGGFDSAVAAYKMMKRGAHVNFVHFWGGGGEPGESSVHVVRKLVEKLTPWQGTAKLCLVPFELLQREIVRCAPENFRILLYRRLMIRIAQRIALSDKSKGLITGDSLGQVASQTLQNMQAFGDVATLPLYRPLVGDDKLEIQKLATQIGTHAISAEKFHDCCPVFLPKSPALFASVEELDAAEASYDVEALVEHGLKAMTRERFRFFEGIVESLGTTRKARA
ncbi:MAG TPA: tRNA uracil 4-sulfurtransferase ThiI [Terriglobales bacterium]|nr:tRNA uracil 4-sulfurtransferase ThiI [Terriglobales bacterium]